jgi:very-short-patch-repair endonuclease
MSQNQPLSRLPFTGEEPKPNLVSVAKMLSEEVCFSPSLVKGRAGEGLVLPYNKNLTTLARKNRSNPTKAETRIWQEVLRMRQFAHYKFLRQKPISGYIVDFYCSELGLVIEIDGDSHAETVEYDLERTRFLNALGLQVIRYTNDEILHNIEGVYDDLSQSMEDK